MKLSGIYKIQSIVKPERIYIGSAIEINRRWSRHLSDLKLNRHSNKKLQNHFNKYGETDLQFSILLSCEKEDLIKIEQYFLDSYNSWFNTYKIAGSPIGHKHSEESKQKMRGNKNLLGFKHSDETRRKMSEAGKGRHPSEETRRKMSISQKAYFATEKGQSDIKKFSELYKNKKRSTETKQHMIEAWRSRKLKNVSIN